MKRPLQNAQHGAVLLEVLLAVALFVAAAAIATASLNSSLRSLDRQRLQTHATQIAASVLAEVQLGIRPTTAATAQPLDPPFQDWTWELATDASPTDFSESSPLERIEVVVRHRTESVVHRLAQRVPPRISGPTNRIDSPVSGGTAR